MKNLLIKLRDAVAYTKFYIQRSTSFLAVINSSMLLYLFISNMNERGIIGFDPEKYIILLISIGILLLIVFGAIDIHIFKSNQSEQVLNYKYNPAMVEIGENIKKIREDLDKINQRLEKIEKS